MSMISTATVSSPLRAFENKTMAKLRHPSRSEALRDYLTSQRDPVREGPDQHHACLRWGKDSGDRLTGDPLGHHGTVRGAINALSAAGQRDSRHVSAFGTGEDGDLDETRSSRRGRTSVAFRPSGARPAQRH